LRKNSGSLVMFAAIRRALRRWRTITRPAREEEIIPANIAAAGAATKTFLGLYFLDPRPGNKAAH